MQTNDIRLSMCHSKKISCSFFVCFAVVILIFLNL